MKNTGRIIISVLLVAMLGGFIQIEKLFAPTAEPWPFWQGSNEDNTNTVDHAVWSGFLIRNLVRGADGIIKVAYGKVTPQDRVGLKGYVDDLTMLPVRSYARKEQLAFWINLYNARTVLLILDHYPVASIQDINLSGGLFSTGPWGSNLMQVEGRGISLNDIEHRILRPGWNDARLHYALNCASLGCPDLQSVAFIATNAEALLDKAARDFINHPRAIRSTQNGFVLSKIYAWFSEDFGGEKSLLTHLAFYAAHPLKELLLTEAIIYNYEYDWALNEPETE